MFKCGFRRPWQWPSLLTVTKEREKGGGGDAQEEGVIIDPACLG